MSIKEIEKRITDMENILCIMRKSVEQLEKKIECDLCKGGNYGQKRLEND